MDNLSFAESDLLFRKRPGTTDRGKDYELLITANLILKLVEDENIEDFILSSNDDAFGDFDDVIFTVKYRDGNTKTYALQLKHAHRGKRLPMASLTTDRGNFSLKKYFYSFLELEKRLSVPDKLIVFTNFTFDADNERISVDEDKILISQYQQEELLATSSEGCCYQFSEEEHKEKYKNFFEKFYLYTNQASVDQIEASTVKMFLQKFCCQQDAFDRYIRFLNVWFTEERRKVKLTKSVMKSAIAIHLLEPFIKPWSFSQNEVNENTKFFREAISQFRVTTFTEDNLQEVIKLWEDAKKLNNITLNSTESILMKYHFPGVRNFREIREIGDKEFTKMLWLVGECPLVVASSETVYKTIEFCDNKKFIVLDSDLFSIGIRMTFQRLSDLKTTNMYENILNNFKCSLQGKEAISLQALTELSEQITTSITTDHMLDMLHKPLIIGKEKENFPPSYLPTLLSKIIIDSQFLETMDEETLILISHVRDVPAFKQHFLNFDVIPIDEFAIQNRMSQEKKKLFISQDECTKLQFDNLCSEKYKKCHHLRSIEEVGLAAFEWVRTKGDTSDLVEFLVSGDHYVDESQFCKYEQDNYVNIVCAKPGMGKTTLMKSLKNRSSPTSWTVLLHTRNHSKHFKEKGDDLYEFEKYVLDEIRQNCKSLDSKILKILMEKRHVIYLWDGLDEVAQETFEAMARVIKKLSQRETVQWISARNNLKKSLETKFNILSRTIIPFDEERQKAYIRDRLQCSEDNLLTIFHNIKNNIQLFSNNDVLGIPLQIYILTELLRHNQEKYATLLNDVFSIAELYEYFVDEQFNIFYKEKQDFDLSNPLIVQFIAEDKRTRTKYYQKASIKIHLEKEVVQKWKINVEIRKEKDLVGFITGVNDEGYPEFFHYSFGEYFAALYLVKQREKVSEICDVIFEEKYNNVRFFFDLIMSKNCKAHIAVLYRNKQLLEKCTEDDINQKDQGGRNALQVACSWGTKYSLLEIERFDNKFIVDDKKLPKLMKTEDLEYQEILGLLVEKCDPTETDHLFTLDSFSYALNSHCLLALVFVLFKSNEKLCYSDEINCTILYLSVRLDYSSTFDVIENLPVLLSKKFRGSLLYLAICCNAINTLQKLLANQNYKKILHKSNELLLHKACENGNKEIVTLLMDSGVNVKIQDGNGRTALHIACTYGNDHIALMLIKNGSPLNVPNKFGRLPIHQACMNGHYNVVKLLLEEEVNMKQPDKQGKLPIHHACAEGRHDIVKLLTDRDKSSIEIATKDGKKPIHFASENGHQEIVELLTSLKAKVNDPDRSRKTPIHYACAGGHYFITQILADKGADLGCKDNKGKTLMHYTCERGDYNSFKFLLDKGTKISDIDESGKAPIHYACAGGFLKIVTQLIEKKASIDVPDASSKMPIDHACENKHYELVKLLIDSGAILTLPDRNGKIFVHRVCEQGHFEVLAYLIVKNVSLEVKSADNKTPMHYAAANGHHEIVSLLLEYNLNLEVADKYGKTPMHYACQNGHYKVAELLIDRLQNKEATDREGEVPLHYAYQGGHFKIVELLVENSVNAEIPDRNGKMLIHRACIDGNLNVLELLIDNEADLEISDEDGEAPIHHACAHGHYDLVNLLIKHEVDVEVRDQHRKRPIDKAREGGYYNIVNLLRLSRSQLL